MQDEPISCLQVKNLVKNYGGRRVVDGLSFDVKKGEIVGLLGPNGAGKTTAFYMTVGLISPDSGQVIFENCDVTRMPMHRRARMGMGYLAQEPSIFRSLTVEQNILTVLEILPISKDDRIRRLEELMVELRIEHLAKKKAGSLSGGERRRLEIARALASRPRCLMLDEPFANIDPISVDEVQKILLYLASKGISVLITDHNAREIFAIAHRSFLVRDGRVMLSGSVNDLLNNAEARNSYFGSEFSL